MQSIISCSIISETPSHHRYGRVSDQGSINAVDGNFAQIPPVVRRGNRADTTCASVRQSFLWPRLQLLSLTQNMCLGSSSTPNDLDFANFISTMSYNHRLYGIFSLPAYIYQTRQLNEFVIRVYRDEDIANSVSTNFWYFSEREILTTRNDTVASINQILTKKPFFSLRILLTSMMLMACTPSLLSIYKALTPPICLHTSTKLSKNP